MSRYKGRAPIWLIVVGVAVATLGFMFLDNFNAELGVVANATRGTVWGIPYRYIILPLAIFFIFYGVLLATQK